MLETDESSQSYVLMGLCLLKFLMGLCLLSLLFLLGLCLLEVFNGALLTPLKEKNYSSHSSLI